MFLLHNLAHLYCFSAFLLLFLHNFGDPPCGHWFPRTPKKPLRADLGSHGPPQTALRADLGSHGHHKTTLRADLGSHAPFKRPSVRTLVPTDLLKPASVRTLVPTPPHVFSCLFLIFSNNLMFFLL